MNLFHWYLLLINAAAFVLMLADKHKARKNLWRIPERVLMGTAILGGSLGVLMGMRIFRHKTQHLKFSIGVPILLAVQIFLLIPLIILF